jgi:hypothetical protein
MAFHQYGFGDDAHKVAYIEIIFHNKSTVESKHQIRPRSANRKMNNLTDQAIYKALLAFYHIPRFSESEHKVNYCSIKLKFPPIFHSNIFWPTNNHGINKMTYVAKSAFILAK